MIIKLVAKVEIIELLVVVGGYGECNNQVSVRKVVSGSGNVAVVGGGVGSTW